MSLRFEITDPGACGGTRDAPLMTEPVLSIIVISYNTKALTLACLASVFAQTRTPFEVVLVDNGSQDETVAAVARAFPAVTLIAEQQNHGFGRAHHIAMGQARAPWVLLLNPDTIVTDHALDRLLTFAQTCPEAGIWGGRTVFPDGTLNPASCWGRMTLWSLTCRATGLTGVFPTSKLFNPEAIGNWPRDTQRAVDIVAGCLFLIRRQTWDDLGGFDPVFYMYGEEADLCLRAKAHGLRSIVTPTAEIIHYGAASETVQADKVVRLLTAKSELIKRHFSPAAAGVGRFLLGMWPVSRAVAFGLVRSEKAALWSRVWARRAEWQDGFAPNSASAAKSGGR